MVVAGLLKRFRVTGVVKRLEGGSIKQVLPQSLPRSFYNTIQYNTIQLNTIQYKYNTIQYNTFYLHFFSWCEFTFKTILKFLQHFI